MEPPASGLGRFVNKERSDGGSSPEHFVPGFSHLLSHEHLICPKLGSHITQGVCPAAEVLQRYNVVGLPVMDYPEGREI